MNHDSPQLLIQKLLDSGFSQARIAKNINISQSTISRIYSGVFKDPKNSVMTKLRQLAEQEAA